MTMRELAERASVSLTTVHRVESGQPASLDVYARLLHALSLPLELVSAPRSSDRSRSDEDVVHAAMGEHEAARLRRHGLRVAIDHPYQHYQFAGRADVLAWSIEARALLHIENRTRFPNVGEMAGSFNAKCRYLADDLARQEGLPPFRSQTHVIAALWSSEVLQVVRARQATFRSLCPDPPDALMDWLAGRPTGHGVTRTFVLLDPFAQGRQRASIDLERAVSGARPRVTGYRQAALRLSRIDRG